MTGSGGSGGPADRPTVTVMLDLRPLQEPERAPITAGYLARLARAFAATPREDERLVAITRALRPDPLPELGALGLRVDERRVLPSTARLGRPVAMTLDGLAQRVAQRRIGAAVYHSASAAFPLGSALPVVVTLLDLAPWELPERYARTLAARIARRQRAGGLRSASRVIVTSPASRESAVRLLDLDPGSVTVVPLAGDEAFARIGSGPELDPAEHERLARPLRLPGRYLVVGGRYDARSDLRTVLQALAALRRQEAPDGATDWPPRLVLPGVAVEDQARHAPIRDLLEHFGVDDLVVRTPPLDDADRAVLTAGAVGHLQPALSDAVGLGALDAIAAGIPVVASRTGCLPGIVASAGIIVEPRDPGRMASAIRTIWEDGPVGTGLRRTAKERASQMRRSWADVAADTRAVYRDALDDAGPGGRE